LSLARRSADMPTLLGLAVGKLAAQLVDAPRTAARKNGGNRDRRIRKLPVNLWLVIARSVRPGGTGPKKNLDGSAMQDYPAAQKLEQNFARSRFLVVNFVQQAGVADQRLVS
jgi:hypothetical protein